MGRQLFAKGLTFTKIKEMHEVGARFKTTTLSDEFTYDDYLQRYQDGSTLLCVLNPDDSLEVNTVNKPLTPTAGQTIIALVGSTAVPDDHAAAP